MLQGVGNERSGSQGNYKGLFVGGIPSFPAEHKQGNFDFRLIRTNIIKVLPGCQERHDQVYAGFT